MQDTTPQHKTDADDVAQLSDRDVRALTEHMDTYADDPATAADEVAVYNRGEQYIINPEAGYCDCDDQHYRQPDGGCKHIRRWQFETGERDIPEWANLDALDDGLDVEAADPKPAIADGGMVHARDTLETERVDGGVLAWDDSGDKPGKRLTGFADVADWDAIRSELVRRGIGVGAMYHKEVYDPAEVGL